MSGIGAAASRWRRVVAVTACALASAALALLSFVGPASARIPTIGPAVPELTSLANDAVRLLNMHLSPAYTLPIDIGWETDALGGDTTPADTNPITAPVRGCQIAVNEAVFKTLTKGNADWEKEIITHEVFHCYEAQLEGDAYARIAATEGWVQEGLARWVDIQLFPSNPIARALVTLKQYFASSTVPLFGRRYDGVGFWGHLQDVSDDLWARIPSILDKAPSGSQATVDVALSGISDEKFFDTWGSSAANLLEGGAPWTARSPDPGAHFSAPAHTIKPAGPNSPVSVALEPYSTDQLHITMPAAPTGDIETVRIDLGGAYGRFGTRDNYTDSELEKLTFCGGPSGCKPTGTPGGGCGAGEVSVPPPSLKPLPSDAMLGVAAAAARVTVTIRYAAVSAQKSTGGGGGCVPAPNSPGSTNGTAGSGGDPHLIDFDGAAFDFQAAGEFTLLKSTRDNLEIQVRQQPFPGSHTVSVNTAVAIRVGGSVVELDPTRAGVSALVDRRPLHGDHASLGGGGTLSLVRQAPTLPKGTTVASACKTLGAETKSLCEKIVQSLLTGSTGAKIHWADGTTVEVWNSLTGPAEASEGGVLGLQVKVAHSRLRHLSGLLGNADVPADQEFHSRSGKSFQAFDILDGDSGPPAQAKIIYGEFGASWRISQRQSLFTYAHGKSTKSYAIAGYPQQPFIPTHTPPSQQKTAAAECHTARVTDAPVLHDCEYDVLATRNTAFVEGAAQLQPVATSYPTKPTKPTKPAKPTKPHTLHPIDLGSGSGQPEVAYDPASGDTYTVWIDDSGSSIDECAVTAAAQSCNGGAGPYRLGDPLAGSGTYFATQVLVAAGGAVVVVAEVEGASAAVGDEGEGIVAWSSPGGGSAFATATQGIANAGRLLAPTSGTGDAPSGGAISLDGTDIGVYGDRSPFGNGFTDFSVTTPATGKTPVVDATGSFGDQLETTASQIASIPDPAAPGSYIVVVVGGDATAPAGCPAGSSGTGFGVATGTPAALRTQAAWSSRYFQPIACNARTPVLAGGGPGGGSIGLLEDEGAGLSGSGSEGVYFRAFDATSDTFGAPLLLSDETTHTVNGATALAIASDKSGGMYAIWLDHRGHVLDYSANGGAAWAAPAAIGLNSDASGAVVAGTGKGNSEIAYTENPGSGSREYLAPVSYSQLAGG